MIARLLDVLLPTLKAVKADVAAKHGFEASFWMKQYIIQQLRTPGKALGGVYEPCFTALVELTLADYSGKKLLDIGCGPLGTLEWAGMTAERVGLDPLVNTYRLLGIDRHKMTYMQAVSEKIPYPDCYFDIVSCFNALDHVDDLDRTVAEIKRVVAKSGLFLLGVDTNHSPTIAEPVAIDWNISKKFSPEFEAEFERHYEKSSTSYIDVMRAKTYFDHDDPRPRPGIIVLKLRKVV